ncbi:MAG TPA: molybdopterin cofactor-binding domain-containing protein [Acidimicrobiales bacterium]|nr:molybdopterin cofactor-binding domain-containing protein [Acidimicrobiales bacterium]
MIELPAALRGTPRLSRWIEFVATDTIIVHTGKVEIGQGILTALAQVVADELDVDLHRVQVPPATTASSVDEGYTAGSMSIEQSATALRLVCAEIRAVFLQAAAARLGVDASGIELDDGTFTARLPGATSSTPVTYWQLRPDVDLDHDAAGTVQPKPSNSWRVIGTSTARRDLPSKIAGVAVFVHDLSFDAMLHGRMVRSSSPGARLVDCDEHVAAGIAGVDAVVRDGGHLGVLAAREEVAVRAAQRLRESCTWTPGARIPDMRHLVEWLQDGDVATRVVDERGAPPTATDPDQIRRIYTRPFLAHASLLPSCAVARWHDETVEVWTHSQGIFALRAVIAEVCDVDIAAVTVHHAEGAGCYGHNGADDVAVDAVLLARAVPGRHVRVQWSREDEFACAPFGPAMAVELAANVSGQGDITWWQSDTWSNTHVTRPGYAGVSGMLAARETLPDRAAADTDDRGGIARNAVPLYDFTAKVIRTHTKLDMPIRTSSLRSLGAFANVFAIESFIDEIAATSGVDPLDLRMRHLKDERARAVLTEAVRASRWGEPCADAIGRGLAVARYKNVGGWCAVVAEVEAIDRVTVRELTVAVDVGLVINPDGLVNQIEGGAIQATSWTLFEEVGFAEGCVATTTWDAYPVLRFEDAPLVNVVVVNGPDEVPFGAGEIAHGPVAAAIANAVFAATGLRARDLPLTRSRLTDLAAGTDGSTREGASTR